MSPPPPRRRAGVTPPLRAEGLPAGMARPAAAAIALSSLPVAIVGALLLLVLGPLGRLWHRGGRMLSDEIDRIQAGAAWPPRTVVAGLLVLVLPALLAAAAGAALLALWGRGLAEIGVVLGAVTATLPLRSRSPRRPPLRAHTRRVRSRPAGGANVTAHAVDSPAHSLHRSLMVDRPRTPMPVERELG